MQRSVRAKVEQMHRESRSAMSVDEWFASEGTCWALEHRPDKGPLHRVIDRLLGQLRRVMARVRGMGGCRIPWELEKLYRLIATPEWRKAEWILAPTTPSVHYQVPIDVARRIKITPLLPDSEIFRSAVENTPGARITADGLELRLVRYQKPEQSGDVSVRTGVFYLPEGDKRIARYRTPKGKDDSKKAYGGSEKVVSATLVKRPFFVKGAVGGRVPEVAYDQVKGKGAYWRVRNDILKTLDVSFNRRSDEAVAKKLLMRYGYDDDSASDLAWRIAAYSNVGNRFPYAISEAIVAQAIREMGSDSIIGYSKRRDGTPFISEVFDLREADYPTSYGYYRLHEKFERASVDEHNIMPFRSEDDSLIGAA